jgi:hypothetical protein
LIIIDKNSLLGGPSIRKRGVGGKNKISQNIESFMGSRLDKREIHWGEIRAKAFALRAGENWNLSPSCGRPSLISPHKTIRDNAVTPF